jgi:hypothetical protein
MFIFDDDSFSTSLMHPREIIKGWTSRLLQVYHMENNKDDSSSIKKIISPGNTYFSLYV